MKCRMIHLTGRNAGIRNLLIKNLTICTTILVRRNGICVSVRLSIYTVRRSIISQVNKEYIQQRILRKCRILFLLKSLKEAETQRPLRETLLRNVHHGQKIIFPFLYQSIFQSHNKLSGKK